jgi:hypothetical protein
MKLNITVISLERSYESAHPIVLLDPYSIDAHIRDTSCTSHRVFSSVLAVDGRVTEGFRSSALVHSQELYPHAVMNTLVYFLLSRPLDSKAFEIQVLTTCPEHDWRRMPSVVKVPPQTPFNAALPDCDAVAAESEVHRFTGQLPIVFAGCLG